MIYYPLDIYSVLLLSIHNLTAIYGPLKTVNHSYEQEIQIYIASLLIFNELPLNMNNRTTVHYLNR